jgi:dCMP deaminase
LGRYFKEGEVGANKKVERPELHEYFMGIAIAVQKRANCTGRRVGAVIVIDDRIVSAGYNGTPEDMPNCDEGGCHRCANPEKYPSGTAYDLCICVHAEQNAILSAARFGIAIEGGTVYTTMQPCSGCTKEMLQAKIRAVYFRDDWRHPDPNYRADHERIQAMFRDGIRKLEMEDPDAELAVSK